MVGGSESNTHVMHATTVAIGDFGILIEGPSGSGKSSLALQLMALGAGLVADDRTELWSENKTIWARAPATLPNAIEARGIGLLPLDLIEKAPIQLVVDLAQAETERLPKPKSRSFFGQKVALVHKGEGPHFPAAILQYVKSKGRLHNDPPADGV